MEAHDGRDHQIEGPRKADAREVPQPQLARDLLEVAVAVAGDLVGNDGRRGVAAAEVAGVDEVEELDPGHRADAAAGEVRDVDLEEVLLLGEPEPTVGLADARRQEEIAAEDEGTRVVTEARHTRDAAELHADVAVAADQRERGRIPAWRVIVDVAVVARRRRLRQGIVRRHLRLHQLVGLRSRRERDGAHAAERNQRTTERHDADVSRRRPCPSRRQRPRRHGSR